MTAVKPVRDRLARGVLAVPFSRSGEQKAKVLCGLYSCNISDKHISIYRDASGTNMLHLREAFTE